MDWDKWLKLGENGHDFSLSDVRNMLRRMSIPFADEKILWISSILLTLADTRDSENLWWIMSQRLLIRVETCGSETELMNWRYCSRTSGWKRRETNCVMGIGSQTDKRDRKSVV